MILLRELTTNEKVLMETLLRSTADAHGLIESLGSILVSEMEDGGMGSLLLVPFGMAEAQRAFGRTVLTGEFTDSDGVLVSVCINVDTGERLYELDVWKADFSELLAWPNAIDLRVCSSEAG